MENELENLIKSEFDHRTLNPSSYAFDKLINKLMVHQKSKQSINLKNLVIAASILGLIFTVGYEFNFKAKTTVKQNVISNIQKKETVPITKETKLLITKTFKKESSLKNKLRSKELVFAKANSLEKMNDDATLTSEKPIEVLALIDKPKTKEFLVNSNVTDAEINELLSSVQTKKLATTRDSLSVNAFQLLYEIEVEINKPLPEKVILTLRSGSRAIKELIKPTNN